MTEFQGGGPEGLEETAGVDAYPSETELNSPAGVVKFGESLNGFDDATYAPAEYNWLTWSNGYEGEVWWNANGNHQELYAHPEYPPGGIGIVPLLTTPVTQTITLPADVKAFYLYAEPDPDSIPWLGPDYANFTVTAPHEGEVGPVAVQGFHGAAYFGCYNEDGLKSISVSSDSPWGFSVGEFGIAAVKYVAMGDSFSSGEGDPPFIDETACHRSKLGYPELLEHGVLDKLPLAFVACSGATTVTGQNQFKSLSKATKVVTVTFGGDDIGFSDILTDCITLGCLPSKLLGLKAVQKLPERIAALKSTLVATYKQILADAPNAAVYVLGYPYLFPPHPGKLQSCGQKGGLLPGDLSYLAAWETQLDEVIKEAVAAAVEKVTYVEPNNLFAGHDVCSTSPWFNPLGSYFKLKSGFHKEYLFHPNTEGQAALEQALVEAGIGSHANDVLRAKAAAGLARAPVGLAQAPVGLAQAPVGLAQAPVRLANAIRRAAPPGRAVRHLGPRTAPLRRAARVRPRHLRPLQRPKRQRLAGVFAPLAGSTSLSVKANAEEASGLITGKVTDTVTGAGVPDICVYAYGFEFGPGFGYAETAADGTYTIESGLPTGSYQVEFYPCERGSEYVGQYYDGQNSYEHATPVNVTDGETTPNINAALAKSGTISGTVTDAVTGKGLEGVCVTASSTNRGIGGGHATTGPEGAYSISSNLTADSYHVEFDPSCNGSNSSSYLLQFYDGASSERSASAVNVAAGSATTGIDASLQQSATISGKITRLAGGEGIGGVCVTASSPDQGPGRGAATTASDGTYTISAGLYTGSYKVYFDPSCERFGSSPYLSQYYQGADRASSATPLLVTAGEASTAISAALPTSARISGTVTEAGSGSPVGGVCVMATPTGTGVGTGSARSAGDGTYTISTGLRAGSYLVEFDPSCSHGFSPTYAAQFYDGAARAASATVVSTTSEATTSGINAALKPPGKITGTVTQAGSDSPLSGVCVDASSSDGVSGYEYATTEANGDYSIAGLPAGSYKVEFNPVCTRSSAYSGELYGEEGGGSPAQVTVSPGETTSGVNAALQASSTISGTVTGGGSPQEGVCVDIASADAAPTSQSTTTASDGTYSVTGLRAGSYTVEFDPSCGGFTHAADLPQFYEGAAAPGEAKYVSVGAGATVSGVDADLQPAGRISGTVTDTASGSPMAGVCITASSTAHGVGYGTATTASDGTYTVQGLAPGAYVIEFDPTCNGTRSSSDGAQFYDGAESPASATDVSVTSGADTSSIDAALQKPGEITGKVTDAITGAPIAGVCVELVSGDSGPGTGFTTTTADGTYSVPELPADSYLVEFEPGCGGTEESSYELERYPESVSVAAGQTRTGIDGALSMPSKKHRVETTTILELSTGAVSYGEEQTEQISVAVASANRTEPTGTVKLSAGHKTACKITLALGSGSCTLSSKKLKAGSYSLVATYKAAKGYASSSSAPAALVVQP